ncbi:NAD-dependent epimerase/dehydratase family protein [Marilutibacter alkalisoli]|uniref:UDP-glucose 4-epimerase n=1 Tax=Marilutibacter alkalisoli TaxID=2591633 RepID=A0A514BUF0_9GAMM|nr:NAD-dependent epimerase/dehydratase family protein [Lysobacter alkalisoli]QDH71034.1 NAD-dependent epimerase/dehydratase family protein [Lysobacter alkalisoli]
MRVVIVGGAGFIGSALAQSLLAKGLRPLVLDTATRLAKANETLRDIATATFDFTMDRNAEALFEGADALVHLACTTNPAHSMESIAWDAESNIAPSIRLFDASVKAGVRRVVFASSGGTVYGAPQRLPVVETDPTLPLSAYGVSKLAIENYLALYSGLEGISLRVANPYGAYQLGGATIGVIARYVSEVMAGRSPEVWGDGSVVRDYIAIEDVVSAFHAALTSEVLRSGAYNIGSGVGTSINQVIDAIREASGRALDAKYLPGRTYDVPAIVLDSSRFANATGWSCRLPFGDGVGKLWQKAQALHAGTGTLVE